MLIGLSNNSLIIIIFYFFYQVKNRLRLADERYEDYWINYSILLIYFLLFLGINLYIHLENFKSRKKMENRLCQVQKIFFIILSVFSLFAGDKVFQRPDKV